MEIAGSQDPNTVKKGGISMIMEVLHPWEGGTPVSQPFALMGRYLLHFWGAGSRFDGSNSMGDCVLAKGTYKSRGICFC